jgi:hypothetical protein
MCIDVSGGIRICHEMQQAIELFPAPGEIAVL